MISIVIPTYNREQILKWTLAEFDKQTVHHSAFEIIIVNDGGEPVLIHPFDYNYHVSYYEKSNNGPASARNFGAEKANYDTVLFIGDDCIPDKNLIFRHLYNHKRDGIKKAVQGYTVWHPDVSSEFQLFLTNISGIQSNFAALRNDDGSWKNRADGFGLTTNYSINKKQFFDMNGFDERFKAAAWEDIEKLLLVN